MHLAWVHWREGLRNVHEELPTLARTSVTVQFTPDPCFRHCAICSRQLYPRPLKREGETGIHLNYYTYWPDTLDSPTHMCACCRVVGEDLPEGFLLVPTYLCAWCRVEGEGSRHCPSRFRFH
jgi:hypothetical protein